MEFEQELLQTIKNDWGWKISSPYRVVRSNAFGNLLVEDLQGVIYKITPEELTAEKIVTSAKDLEVYFNDQEHLEDWEMARLVALAENHYGKLEKGECFGFKMWPALNGSYDIENIVKYKNMKDWIGASGDVARQTHDLPDGSQVEFKVVP